MKEFNERLQDENFWLSYGRSSGQASCITTSPGQNPHEFNVSERHFSARFNYGHVFFSLLTAVDSIKSSLRCATKVVKGEIFSTAADKLLSKVSLIPISMCRNQPRISRLFPHLLALLQILRLQRWVLGSQLEIIYNHLSSFHETR